MLPLPDLAMLQPRMPDHKVPRDMLKAIDLPTPHHIARQHRPAEATPVELVCFGTEVEIGVVDGAQVFMLILGVLREVVFLEVGLGWEGEVAVCGRE
jgi:hypothetical protein